MSKPSLIPGINILRALQDGPGARRTIAVRAGIDLNDGVMAGELDRQLSALRKSGDVYCNGQSYKITDKGRITALGDLYIVAIREGDDLHAAIVSDPEIAAEIYRRMQVTQKTPIAYMRLIEIDNLSRLPEHYVPGGPEPRPGRVLHSVYFKGFVVRETDTLGGDSKTRIACIKAIREVTGCGLKEAKDAVETGGLITRDADDEQAARLIKALVEVGGIAEWRSENDRIVA